MKSKQPSLNKISPPTMPDVIQRERLFELLDQKDHFKVTWISSQAGSGKTTLAASYLESRDIPSLWYQVDEGDADLSTFFYYMGLAAKKAAPRKRTSLPLLTPEYLLGLSVFSIRYFEKMSRHLSSRHVIVLDNYQEIPAESPFHSTFRDGLSGISPDLHLIILSRADPPSEFAGLLANNVIRKIEFKDIRLSFEEAGEIVSLETGRDFEHGLIQKIHEKASGWAVGLILLARYLKGEDLKEENFKDITPEEVFDYFVNELFERVDQKTRDFLLKTSFLTSMTVSAAQKLTGQKNAESMYKDLRRNHFFTERFHTDSPVYQYHPLFREFLNLKAKNSFTDQEIKQLQLESAALSEESGHMEDAADLFYEAGHMEGVIRMILTHAMTLIAQGRYQTLQKWLKRVPKGLFEENPWLYYWQGFSVQSFMPLGALEYFQKAFQLFDEKKDIPGLLLSWSGAVDSIHYSWDDFSLHDQWAVWFDDHIGPDYEFPSVEIETQLVVSLTNVLVLRRLDHPDMIHWLNRAMILAQNMENKFFYLLSLCNACIYAFVTGDLVQLEIRNNRMKQLAGSPGAVPYMKIITHFVNSYYTFFLTGDSASALKSVSSMLELSHETGIRILDHMAFFGGGHLSLAMGDFQQAADFMKKLEATLDHNRRNGYCFFHHLSALYHFLSGESERAVEHARNSLKMARQTGHILMEWVCSFSLAQTLYEKGNTEEAEKYLARVWYWAGYYNTAIFKFMVILARARIDFDQENDQHGLEKLRQALALGREKGFVAMIWWLQPDMMSRLCARALENGIEVEYVKKIIRIQKLFPAADEYDVKDWPWPLEIHTLNGFQIYRDGRLLGFKRKVQHKPLEILKILIALGGQEVSKEKIMDLIWEESDGDMADSAFATTLNRLRTLINHKDVVKLLGGKVTLDRKYCWIDAWVFEDLLDRARSLDQKGQGKEAFTVYQKAIDLYQGPFLAEDGESTWILTARERIQNKYLKAVLRMGRYMEEKEAFEKAAAFYQKGIEIDELEEVLYQRLMKCFHKLGQPAEAVKTFHRCRETLEKELNVEPQEKTLAVYREMKGG